MTTETDKTTQERERFEAHFKGRTFPMDATEYAWEIWQARAALDTGSVTDKASTRPVPAGQTPLDARLSHPLLLVFAEGEKARDTGAASPYHGHSLEHCLHAAGWVQRDLMIALDAAKKRLAAPQPPASAEDVDLCPVCAEPIREGDTCATDIEMGTCHAACLEGSPVVDLETGAPSDGPVTTFVREAELPPASASAEPLTIVYHNWRGETATRRVIPQHVYFGSTEWHHKPQWVMRALDVDKGEVRDFAMRDMERACCEGGSDCTCHEQDASASAGKVEPVPEKRGSASVPMTVCHECGESLAESDAQWTDDGSPFCKHHSFDPAPAQPVAVSVKPLEWVARQHTPMRLRLEAATEIGTWRVFRFDDGWCWWRDNDSRGAYLASEAEAKAAAQADYEQRIRSLLVIEPAPDARQAAEEIERYRLAMKNMGDVILDYAKGRDVSVHRSAGAEEMRQAIILALVAHERSAPVMIGMIRDAIRALPLPGDKEE